MASFAALTSLVDALVLVISLWLGVYVVTRNPRSRVSWLAGLTLCALSGYFLDSFLHLNRPTARLFDWWMGWTILFAAPLWLHLVVSLLPRPQWWHRLAVWGACALALALLLVELTTGKVFGVLTAKPFVYASAQRPGVLYPLLCLLLILSPTLALAVLYQCWQQSKRLALRRQFGVLTLATLLAAVASAYLTLSVWFRLDALLLWGHVVLGAALVLLGYGVARYNALIAWRASQLDFGYSAVAIAVVVGVYLIATYVSHLVFGIPLAVFIFVLILVILSHSLYEWGGAALERLLYRRHYLALKTRMRAFVREAQSLDLAGQLGAVLETVCQSMGCGWGWVGLRDGGGFAVAATHPAQHKLPADVERTLLVDEIMVCDEGILAPLFVRGEQIGVLVLGHKTEGQPYVKSDLDMLDQLADQVAGIVYAGRQQDVMVRQIGGLVDEFHQRGQVLQAEVQAALEVGQPLRLEQANQGDMKQLVEDALRHLHDYAYLGEHRLARLRIVERRLDGVEGIVTHLDRGKALSLLLIDVLDKLRPPGPTPKTLTREWVQYTILHNAYVLGELNRDIMIKLYISESSFNRARRRAVRGVARAIAEMERTTQSR